MPRKVAVLDAPPLAEIELPAADRRYHSRLTETLEAVRSVLIKAPAGSLVVKVECRES